MKKLTTTKLAWFQKEEKASQTQLHYFFLISVTQVPFENTELWSAYDMGADAKLEVK